MDKIEITEMLISSNYSMVFSSDNNYIINWDKLGDNDVSFLVKENVHVTILEIGDNKKKNITYKLESNSYLTLNICSLKTAYDTTYKFDVGERAHVEAAYADFDSGKKNCLFYFALNGNDSIVNWHLASLSKNNDDKEFQISFDHVATNTYAFMDSYGVCEDDAKLIFSGTGSILRGAKKTRTHQNAKIMVFDEKCNATTRPALCIDENDVEASHAATVGKVSDEHLFYLCSRGIREEDAKRLITLGYLNPILKHFDDEEISSQIADAINRRA